MPFPFRSRSEDAVTTIRRWGPFSGRQLTTIAVALILAVAAPTAAYGFTLGHTAITDATSKATASVTPAGNLQVAVAAPSAFVQTGSVAVVPSTNDVLVANASATTAMVISTIHIGTFADPTPGSGQFVSLSDWRGANCSGSPTGTYFQYVTPGGIGETDIPLDPGLGVPAGGSFCAQTTGSLKVDISVSGYSAPAGSVP